MTTHDIFKTKLFNQADQAITWAALADSTVTPNALPNAAYLLVFNGTTWYLLRSQSKRVDLGAATAIGSIVTVWPPAAGKRFRLMGGSISVSAAVSVLFEDNVAGTAFFICRTPKLLADTPFNFDLGQGYLSQQVGWVLKATGSGAANITGVVYGTEE